VTSRVYPLHRSFRNDLKSVDSPLIALKLISQVSFNLDVSYDETAIVIYLASRTQPASLEEISKAIEHVGKLRVKELLAKLITNRIVIKHDSEQSSKTRFELESKILPLLAAVDKSMVVK
jgi:sugar diacid utilization regulator